MKISMYSAIIVFILIGSMSCVSHDTRENKYLPIGGNINAINYQKIPGFLIIEDDFTNCKKIEYMIENWAYKWNYDIPKNDIIVFLLDFQKTTTTLAAQYPGNVEILLLQMLLSIYLYNLESYDEIELLPERQNSIHKLNPSDYRADWFYGSFLCRSNKNVKGIRLLTSIIHDNKEAEITPYFWKDFIYCASLAGMPSHVLMSSDKVMKYFGELTFIEDFLKTNSEKLLILPENGIDLDAEEIWSYKKAEGYVMATNRLSGMAIKVKNEWEIQPLQYQNNMSGILIQPEIELTEQGEIGYNFLILGYKPLPDESLVSFINQFLHKDTYTIKEITLKPELVKDSIAFFGTNESLYPNVGGGRMILCGIEREEPLYPGVALEMPLQMSRGDSDEEKQYFRVNKMYKRLPGRIFYVILLDTCGLIYDTSLANFESFIEHNLIIE